MKELPSPTLPLSPSPRGTLHPSAQAEPTVAAAPGIRVSWARHQDEVRQAQRLRYRVFAEEMGAQLSGPLPGHDIDLFDDYCEHLLVRDSASDAVIGTYRVLTPAQAARVGRCVHPEHRHGGVILALWGALTQFMVRNQLDVMIGCASVPMQHQGLPGGHAAASIWRQLRATHLAPLDCHVLPRLPLPVHQLDQDLSVEPPALIKGYLRLGAKVLGPPAWDPDFNTADLPMMMRTQDLPMRYRRHFAAGLS